MTRHLSKIKFATFDVLATFFQWLEGFAGKMYNHTNLCHSCGQPKYFSKPCVRFEEVR